MNKLDSFVQGRTLSRLNSMKDEGFQCDHMFIHLTLRRSYIPPCFNFIFTSSAHLQLTCVGRVSMSFISHSNIRAHARYAS